MAATDGDYRMSLPSYFDRRRIETTDRELRADVCVYGATAAGCAAAATVARAGKSVVLLQPGGHVGGMTTAGLGWTDAGKRAVVGGFALELYRRIGQLAGRPEEWLFWPSQAQRALDAILAEAGVQPLLHQYLDHVVSDHGVIQSMALLGGLRVAARFFIDATYEGDLLAKAGCSFHVGREGNDTYGERANGIYIGDKHQFVPARVSALRDPADPASGLLPGVEAIDLRPLAGQGDHRIQAYNFRVCMTDDPDLRVPFAAPKGYGPADYELAARWFALEEKDPYNDSVPNYPGRPEHLPKKFDAMTDRTAGGYFKTDTNNHGPVSSDLPGGSWQWPSASYEQRERIFQAHLRWQLGLYHFMATDPRIPERYARHYRDFGLPRDEFTDTGHWPHQLYVREARRLIGQSILTEHDCLLRRPCRDPIGMGSYQMDSHNCTRFVTPEGTVLNEGDVQLPTAGPYPIGLGATLPRDGAANLFVPVCCSTSHIAYGSVRMEPVFMILGQSVATAACLALDCGLRSVTDLPYAPLRERLLSGCQVLP
jgi:hypothetical protein